MRDIDLKLDLERALSCLPVRHALVLRLRFGLADNPRGLIRAEIAKDLGISVVRVAQLERQALQALRGCPWRKRRPTKEVIAGLKAYL